MVLTANQVSAFFEDQAQLGIPHATRIQLQQEGILTVEDLAEFEDDAIKQIAENLRRPTGRVPDPTPGAAVGATIPTPPFEFGAKSQKRFKAAAKLLRYYETVGRDVTAVNVRWDPTIKRFIEHWQALCDRKKGDTPETPKITRALPVTKWTECFADFTHRVCGARTIPLAYVIRATVLVPGAAPPLAVGEPYSVEHGSVEEELIARASHDHPLYREDNAKLYYFLEEATRTTSYAASLKPYQRRKDGRAAWFAIVQQYAGVDKWQAELKQQDDLLHTRRWKGQSSFSLDKLIAQHRNAYITMSQCAVHIPFQLPNEQTRVTYLLDAIECSDAALQAAMALVRNDAGPAGKMNDFEAAAAFIVPHDPVAKKRQANPKRPFADVSHADGEEEEADVNAVEGQDEPAIRTGIGRTGVELRFHKQDEYIKLTDEQKEELREHRDSKEKEGKGRKLSKGKNRSSNPSSKRMKALIADAVAKELSEKSEKETAAEDTEKQFREYLISVVKGTPDPKKANANANANASSAAAKPPAVTLSAILGRMTNKST